MATISETGRFICFEKFTNLEAPITDVRWWSLFAQNFSNPCAKASTPRFEVSFYADSADQPGALVAGPFTVTTAGVPTGASYNAFPVTQFEISVPPVDLATGWVSIAGLPDAETPDCAHFWMSASGDDGRTIVRQGSSTFLQPYDSSLCIATHPVGLMLGDMVAWGSDLNQDGVLDAADLGRR